MEKNPSSLLGVPVSRLSQAVHRRVPGLVAVYVFGSTGAGTRREGSDVDLAFLTTAKVSGEVRFALACELEELLTSDVDLIDLRGSSTVLQMQVISKGEVIADLEHAARVAFEDFVFSSYARLNEERASILDRVRAEGRVYGG